MQTKSTFIIVLLVIALIGGYVYFNGKLSEQKGAQRANIPTQDTSSDEQNTANIAILEDLNNQLITAQNRIKELEKKTVIAKATPKVLDDEIAQNQRNKAQIKLLQNQLKDAESDLQAKIDEFRQIQIELASKNPPKPDDIAAIKNAPTVVSKTKQVSAADRAKVQELTSLIEVFQEQNKSLIQKNIGRISTLKSTSSGIAISAAIIPAVGIATLISFTIEEIKNYCQSIQDAIDLEKNIFSKTISLDPQTYANYHRQCGK